MGRRELVRAARRGRVRVYVGRGYARPRLVRAILAGFGSTGPHPVPCDAYRIRVQVTCEDDPQAVAEWIGGIDGVCILEIRDREIVIARRTDDEKRAGKRRR